MLNLMSGQSNTWSIQKKHALGRKKGLFIDNVIFIGGHVQTAQAPSFSSPEQCMCVRALRAERIRQPVFWIGLELTRDSRPSRIVMTHGRSTTDLSLLDLQEIYQKSTWGDKFSKKQYSPLKTSGRS
ncbi:hypothetical protein KQX54_010541 [Cotesia glomerata]|uniref:Uncharacterized protein n=1 Tax=Cotesia glomerata TaxID=32391 RepID=A0AAV7IHI7_COTGL|nr:hypothetical protein KQX54_010541 [Cotesia glomerata]